MVITGNDIRDMAWKVAQVFVDRLATRMNACPHQAVYAVANTFIATGAVMLHTLQMADGTAECATLKDEQLGLTGAIDQVMSVWKQCDDAVEKRRREVS